MCYIQKIFLILSIYCIINNLKVTKCSSIKTLNNTFVNDQMSSKSDAIISKRTNSRKRPGVKLLANSSSEDLLEIDSSDQSIMSRTSAVVPRKGVVSSESKTSVVPRKGVLMVNETSQVSSVVPRKGVQDVQDLSVNMKNNSSSVADKVGTNSSIINNENIAPNILLENLAKSHTPVNSTEEVDTFKNDSSYLISTPKSSTKFFKNDSNSTFSTPSVTSLAPPNTGRIPDVTDTTAGTVSKPSVALMDSRKGIYVYSTFLVFTSITVFVVVLIAGCIVYNRLKTYWFHRHYSRVDFLIDGLYEM